MVNPGSIPGQRAKIPHALQPKNQKLQIISLEQAGRVELNCSAELGYSLARISAKTQSTSIKILEVDS